MPLYRFSTTYGDAVYDKGDALDLNDDQAAWEEATVSTGEILRGLDGSLRPNREWRMDVTDEAGTEVFSIRVLGKWHR